MLKSGASIVVARARIRSHWARNAHRSIQTSPLHTLTRRRFRNFIKIFSKIFFGTNCLHYQFTFKLVHEKKSLRRYFSKVWSNRRQVNSTQNPFPFLFVYCTFILLRGEIRPLIGQRARRRQNFNWCTRCTLHRNVWFGPCHSTTPLLSRNIFQSTGTSFGAFPILQASEAL